MTLVRVEHNVPGSEIPFVDVAEGEICYVLDGYSQAALVSSSPGRYTPANIPLPRYDREPARLLMESNFLDSVNMTARWPIHDPNYKATLHVFHTTDGLALAVTIAPVPAIPRGPGKPAWTHLLDDDFLDE
jgi:hypothetical protein